MGFFRGTNKRTNEKKGRLNIKRKDVPPPRFEYIREWGWVLMGGPGHALRPPGRVRRGRVMGGAMRRGRGSAENEKPDTTLPQCGSI